MKDIDGDGKLKNDAQFRRIAGVDLAWEVDTNELPEARSAHWPASGRAGNHCYCQLHAESAAYILRVATLEAELVDSVAPYNGDEIAGIEAEAEFDDRKPKRAPQLDLGVCAVSLALASFGCVPVSSCNGGAFSDGHHEVYPLVAFYCIRKTFLELQLILQNSEVGMKSGAGGVLILYARDVRALVQVALVLVRQLAITQKRGPAS